MELARGLYEFLKEYPGVTALVGTRIYPVTFPQNVILPAITYQRVSDRTIHSHGGSSNFAYTLFRIMTWAWNYGDARQAARAVKSALVGYRGMMGARWVGSILHDNDLDNYDEQTKMFSVISDYTIGHNEPE